MSLLLWYLVDGPGIDFVEDIAEYESIAEGETELLFRGFFGQCL